MPLMPGEWAPYGPDQVVVVLCALVAAGFWAACKLHDIVQARRAKGAAGYRSRVRGAAVPDPRGSSHPSTQLGRWDR